MDRDEEISIGPPEEVALVLGWLLRDGQPERTASLVDRALDRDPRQGGDDAAVARLLLIKFAALLNLERLDLCPAVADAAHSSLGRCDAPALLGEFHALSGVLAYFQGALERCVTHLVRGTRALERVRADDHDSALAWLDLSTAYSYISFHEEAVQTLARAQQAAVTAGDPVSYYAHPEIRVRHALWLDYQGDTEGCIRELTEVYTTIAPEDIEGFNRPHLAYGGARLAALGVPVERNPASVLAGYPLITPEERALALLTDACLAIADGRAAEALVSLDSPMLSGIISDAEVLRVRALALAAAGDYKAALSTERASVAAIVNGPGRLNSLYIEGITARLDQDELRRSLTRFTDEAHTDPLTGLPNRRHLERYVSDLTSHGTYGTIGVADLNGFKAINTVHGHLSGDEVLQQVAALLTRAMRAGDFLARYGGDEFVVILPETGLDEAADISERLLTAVDRFDWATIVPSTPVSLAIGLAELGPRVDFTAAFQVADLVMLREKAGMAAGAR
ncbi:MAG TPA: GGDEF domain-containing protein [Actinocrinis sp.]|nr:GGDEF domain-containing protein [Actinocrinis sp.]